MIAKQVDDIRESEEYWAELARLEALDSVTDDTCPYCGGEGGVEHDGLWIECGCEL